MVGDNVVRNPPKRRRCKNNNENVDENAAFWHNDAVQLILEKVGNHECLYAVSSPNYYNRHLKNDVWDAIAAEVCKIRPNTTRNEVKYKFQRCRSQYSQEVAKINKSKKSGAGIDDIYKPSLWYFAILHPYLEREVEARKSKSTPLCDITNQDPVTTANNEPADCPPKIQNDNENEDDFTLVFNDDSLGHDDEILTQEEVENKDPDPERDGDELSQQSRSSTSKPNSSNSTSFSASENTSDDDSTNKRKRKHSNDVSLSDKISAVMASCSSSLQQLGGKKSSSLQKFGDLIAATIEELPDRHYRRQAQNDIWALLTRLKWECEDSMENNARL